MNSSFFRRSSISVLTSETPLAFLPKIKRVQEENKQLNLAIVSSNNHYAGFGPGTVNIFRKMVGLSEISWSDPQQIQRQLLQLRQRQQEQDQHISNSNVLSNHHIKKRQSSITEFIE